MGLFGSAKNDQPEESTPQSGKKQSPLRKVQGPLYGWRWWTLEDGVLLSPVQYTRWEGPSLVAHEVPKRSALLRGFPDRDWNGVYCYHSRKAAIDIGTTWPSERILGKVEISGKVVKHELGFRVERATVVELFGKEVDYEVYTIFGFMKEKRGITPEIAAKLEERYQCPVTVEWGVDGDIPPRNSLAANLYDLVLAEAVRRQPSANTMSGNIWYGPVGGMYPGG